MSSRTVRDLLQSALNPGAQAQEDAAKEWLKTHSTRNPYVYKEPKKPLFPEVEPEDAEIISETKW